VIDVRAGDADLDGDSLTVTAVSNPANGSATINADGTVTYAPAANFNGSDSFTYTISDGNGGSSTASVSIVVNAVNDAPSFTKGANQTSGAGSQTVNSWATAISAGPANESAQSLEFLVSADNTALFSVQPAIAANGTLTYTIASGASGSATVTVSLRDNGGTANGGVDTSAPQTFTISVAEGPVTISIANVSVVEGNSGLTPANFIVSLNHAASTQVTVNYSTINGTARADRDYQSKSGTLTFAPGDVSETVTINVVGETTKESSETFGVRLSGAVNATIADNEGMGTIVNDDGTPNLNTSSAKTVEGDSGTQLMTFAVTPTNGNDQQMTVAYTTVASDGAREGQDYEPITGVLTFPPESTDPQFVTVKVLGDKRHERRQTVLLRLLEAFEAIPSGLDGVGEIEDDDPAPTISVADVTVGEAVSGSVKAAIAVTLSNETDETVTVDYATADGSAAAGQDFEAASGTLTFLPGSTSQVVTITVNAAAVDELIETFTVDLANVIGAAVAKGRGFVTITPPAAWVTSTLADFGLGTLGAGGYLAGTSGGEIILAPTVGTEFNETALPAGWQNGIIPSGGSMTFGDGAIQVDGVTVLTTATFLPARSLEFSATFTGVNQNVGFGVTSALLPPFAMIGVKADGQLYARSAAPGKIVETPIPGNWLNTPHHFRIDWTAGGATYWVDGQQKAVHVLTFRATSTYMKPAITDLAVGDGALRVDWVRMSAFAGSGSYTSPVFDAGQDVLWQAASWLADLPTNTSVVVEVRTGTAEGVWSEFRQVAKPGDLINSTLPSSRYAQYRVTLATTVPNTTPALKEVTLTFVK
jgi:hypothetical protein